MKFIFKKFRDFTKSQPIILENIEDMVEKYYSDLPEEEKNEKVLFFADKLNKSVEKNGEWVTKTILHSIEQKMKAEKRRRSASPEEIEAQNAKNQQAMARSREDSRKMTQKYGRRWNK